MKLAFKYWNGGERPLNNMYDTFIVVTILSDNEFACEVAS